MDYKSENRAHLHASGTKLNRVDFITARMVLSTSVLFNWCWHRTGTKIAQADHGRLRSSWGRIILRVLHRSEFGKNFLLWILNISLDWCLPNKLIFNWQCTRLNLNFSLYTKTNDWLPLLYHQFLTAKDACAIVLGSRASDCHSSVATYLQGFCYCDNDMYIFMNIAIIEHEKAVNLRSLPAKDKADQISGGSVV